MSESCQLIVTPEDWQRQTLEGFTISCTRCHQAAEMLADNDGYESDWIVVQCVPCRIAERVH